MFVITVLPFSKAWLERVVKLMRDFLWEGRWHAFKWELASSPWDQGELGLDSLTEKARRKTSK